MITQTFACYAMHYQIAYIRASMAFEQLYLIKEIKV